MCRESQCTSQRVRHTIFVVLSLYADRYELMKGIRLDPGESLSIIAFLDLIRNDYRVEGVVSPLLVARPSLDRLSVLGVVPQGS